MIDLNKLSWQPITDKTQPFPLGKKVILKGSERKRASVIGIGELPAPLERPLPVYQTLDAGRDNNKIDILATHYAFV